ncbi:MAG: DNA-binding protein [Thermoprotei archaeon]|nr:MAG: DNA-binding protein [Thermoprotei archaeon]
MLVHVGLDDFDSPLGNCTTYVGARLAIFLDSLEGVELLDYPYLVRLNPNVPFKTRGNGAVALRLRVRNYCLEELAGIVLSKIEELIELRHPKTDPVVVFKVGEVGSAIKSLYWKALRSVVALSVVERLAQKEDVLAFKWKRGRGLIGALAALGVTFNDYTFELLSYRRQMAERRLVRERLEAYDADYSSYTFANVDYRKERVLVTPRGPDPVYFGIRGENPLVLLDFILNYVDDDVRRNIDFWVIFKTNQATGVHFESKRISDVRPYDSVCIEGTLASKVRILRGGHVLFRVKDREGEVIECSVYRETGRLNSLAKVLSPGMFVRVFGSVRPSSPKHGITINVEQIEILEPSHVVITHSPICPKCGKRMKSAGKGKGYKCPRCAYWRKDLEKTVIRLPHIVEPGLYLPSSRAYRHLTKPESRYGVKRSPVEFKIIPWYGTFKIQ